MLCRIYWSMAIQIHCLFAFFLHKAPHLVRFHLQMPDDHIPGRCHGPHMLMVRQRCKAGGDKMHEPSDTDANRAANAMEGDFLTESRDRDHSITCIALPIYPHERNVPLGKSIKPLLHAA